MGKRFITIWFRYLTTDWLALRKPELKQAPLVLAATDHSRLVVMATNPAGSKHGITPGMPVADAKAIVPDLQVIPYNPDLPGKLLKALGEWCIRYTPVLSVDLPDGLILDVSGCTHLWGGERAYLNEIITRLSTSGYHVRAAMADTIGAAWAVSRFGKTTSIVPEGEHAAALLDLPPASLRLDPEALTRLQKLGLFQIRSFMNMPRSVLRRRFGETLLVQLARALGHENEPLPLLQLVEPYEERLPCLEPIRTATGIEIAITRLLESVCNRLQQEGKGLRTAHLSCYRVDGKMEYAEIGTNHASHHVQHLFKLFELKIPQIEPALGIELFVLTAKKVEDVPQVQEALWAEKSGLESPEVAELLDRLAGKVGAHAIHRYLPAEHHWPERSIRQVSSLSEKPTIPWRTDRPRPVKLLPRPEPVTVSAPIPDYPPMLFNYKGKVHHVKKADGPERIEREWWLDDGRHRDYYQVEDEDGCRYWLFRSGHYSADEPAEWFLHGFFA